MHVYYSALWRHVLPGLAMSMGTLLFFRYVAVGIFEESSDSLLGYFGAASICAVVLVIVLGFNWFWYEAAVEFLFKEAVTLFFPRPVNIRSLSVWGPPPLDQHPLWRSRRDVIAVHWGYVRSTPVVQETFLQLLADSGGELTLDLFRLAREVATPALVAA